MTFRTLALGIDAALLRASESAPRYAVVLYIQSDCLPSLHREFLINDNRVAI